MSNVSRRPTFQPPRSAIRQARRLPRLGVCIAGSAWAAACHDEPPPTAPSRAVAAAVRDSVTLADVPAEERAFAELARMAPNTAGFYYDEQGTVVVPTVGPSAATAIRYSFDRLGIAGPGAQRGRRAAGVRSVPAKYTFTQLARWRELAFTHALTGVDGVTSLDLDEARNRVAIGLEPSRFVSVRAQVRTRLHRVGVDTAALVFDSLGRTRPDVGALPPDLVSESPSTLAGGLSIVVGTTSGCTLGFAAVRDGVNGLVTNSHCTRLMYNPDADPMFQLSNRQVGTESVDPNAYTCGVRRCRGADAAFFTSTGAVPLGVGLLFRTTYANGGGLAGGNGSLIVEQTRPYWVVAGDDMGDYPDVVVYVGLEVHKLGRTTGWTRGTVKQTCVDHWVTGNSVMRCGYEALYVADHGDSGGPVFAIMGPDSVLVRLLGIHVGRAEAGNDQARFAKLSRIVSDLGGQWTFTRPPVLGSPQAAGAITGANPSITWNPVPGANRYQVVGREEWCQPIFPPPERGPGCAWTVRETRYVTTGTSFTDGTRTVVSLLPAGSGPSLTTRTVAYTVIALSDAERSNPSAQARYSMP